MSEYSKIEDMPLGAAVLGICLEESTDIMTALSFPVTQIETDSEKGYVFLYLDKSSPLRAEISIARGTWVEWERT